MQRRQKQPSSVVSRQRGTQSSRTQGTPRASASQASSSLQHLSSHGPYNTSTSGGGGLIGSQLSSNAFTRSSITSVPFSRQCNSGSSGVAMRHSLSTRSFFTSDGVPASDLQLRRGDKQKKAKAPPKQKKVREKKIDVKIVAPEAPLEIKIDPVVAVAVAAPPIDHTQHTTKPKKVKKPIIDNIIPPIPFEPLTHGTDPAGAPQPEVKAQSIAKKSKKQVSTSSSSSSSFTPVAAIAALKETLTSQQSQLQPQPQRTIAATQPVTESSVSESSSVSDAVTPSEESIPKRARGRPRKDQGRSMPEATAEAIHAVDTPITAEQPTTPQDVKVSSSKTPKTSSKKPSKAADVTTAVDVATVPTIDVETSLTGVNTSHIQSTISDITAKADDDSTGHGLDLATISAPNPVKRGRGRPRKVVVELDKIDAVSDAVAMVSSPEVAFSPQREEVTPPKVASTTNETTNETTSLHTAVVPPPVAKAVSPPPTAATAVVAEVGVNASEPSQQAPQQTSTSEQDTTKRQVSQNNYDGIVFHDRSKTTGSHKQRHQHNAGESSSAASSQGPASTKPRGQPNYAWSWESSDTSAVPQTRRRIRPTSAPPFRSGTDTSGQHHPQRSRAQHIEHTRGESPQHRHGSRFPSSSPKTASTTTVRTADEVTPAATDASSSNVSSSENDTTNPMSGTIEKVLAPFIERFPPKKQINKRVVIGLSGGVDSAVAAALLVQRGYKVIPVHMTNWDLSDENNKCTANDDLFIARKIAKFLNLELHEVNFAKDYWNRVFEPALQQYMTGSTPNPDIHCNRTIKFGKFLDYSLKQLKADYVATGHYARLLYPLHSKYTPKAETLRKALIKQFTATGNTNALKILATISDEELVKRAQLTYDPLNAAPSSQGMMVTSIDPVKDQTYFLSNVSPKQLEHVMFPLGHLEKKTIRDIAAKIELPNSTRKDSVGLCFVGKRASFGEFLSDFVPEESNQPGKVVPIEALVFAYQAQSSLEEPTPTPPRGKQPAVGTPTVTGVSESYDYINFDHGNVHQATEIRYDPYRSGAIGKKQLDSYVKHSMKQINELCKNKTSLFDTMIDLYSKIEKTYNITAQYRLWLQVELKNSKTKRYIKDAHLPVIPHQTPLQKNIRAIADYINARKHHISWFNQSHKGIISYTEGQHLSISDAESNRVLHKNAQHNMIVASRVNNTFGLKRSVIVRGFTSTTNAFPLAFPDNVARFTSESTFLGDREHQLNDYAYSLATRQSRAFDQWMNEFVARESFERGKKDNITHVDGLLPPRRPGPPPVQLRSNLPVLATYKALFPLSDYQVDQYHHVRLFAKIRSTGDLLPCTVSYEYVPTSLLTGSHSSTSSMENTKTNNETKATSSSNGNQKKDDDDDDNTKNDIVEPCLRVEFDYPISYPANGQFLALYRELEQPITKDFPIGPVSTFGVKSETDQYQLYPSSAGKHVVQRPTDASLFECLGSGSVAL